MSNLTSHSRRPPESSLASPSAFVDSSPRLSRGIHDDGADHLPRKRAKSSNGPTESVRRRAPTACHACRLKKTRCNNQRPICDNCIASGIECAYPEKRTERATEDSGNIAILDKLQHVVELLEQHGSALANVANEVFAAGFSSTARHLPTSETYTNSGFDTHISSGGDEQGDIATTLTDALNVSSSCAAAGILLWPIFECEWNPSEVDAYFFEPDGSLGTDADSNSVSLSSREVGRSSDTGRGLREEDAVSLARRFLERVHVKNPILDPAALLRMAKKVAEEGFQWDDSSCIVMLACALASLATNFACEHPREDETSLCNAYDYSTAEQYYTAARKRIGLIESPLVSTQCAFLIGVYQMYSMRPVKGWLSFSTACMMFQAHLRGRSRNHLDQAAQAMEQRLYWTCLKSECEMREVVGVPPTGIFNVADPDVFPSPPTHKRPPGGTSSDGGTSDLEHVFQNSWFYYLSEIAFRRILNRVTNTLHSKPSSKWLSYPICHLHRLARELEAQATQLSEHLPFPAPGQLSLNPSDELHFCLSTRAEDIRERIWRPFLFIAIHGEEEIARDPTVRECAATALSLASQIIRRATIKHRHHGSWFAARSVFACALILLAAAKSGRVEIPADCESLVTMAEVQLGYWQDECTDLGVARRVLMDVRKSVQFHSNGIA